jgi:O-antigen ligase
VASWQLSFVERIQDMWPRAFDLFASPMQVLWGRGLGGIGTAQTFDEWNRANAGDNLMVYVLVTFGIFGLAYIAIFLGVLFRFLESRTSDDLIARMSRGWVIVWLSFGLTTNMLEEPMTNMVIGMTFGWVFGVGRAPSTGIVPRRSRARQAAGEQPLGAGSGRTLDA